MIFLRRTLRSYGAYIFFFSCSLTLLVLFVQLLEKSASGNTSSFGALFWYLLLDAFPTFLFVMPIATWLAMLALMRDWLLRAEWEGMLILGISEHALLKMFLIFHSVLALLFMLLYYAGGDFLAQQAAHFKRYHLKKKETISTVIEHKLLLLDTHTCCFIEHYDPQKDKGSGLFLFALDQNSTHGEKNYRLFKTFYYDKKKQVLLNNQHEQIAFCPHKSLSQETEMQEEMISFTCLLLQLLFCAPLALLFFSAGYQTGSIRWYGPAVLYPILFVCSCLGIVYIAGTILFLFLIYYNKKRFFYADY